MTQFQTFHQVILPFITKIWHIPAIPLYKKPKKLQKTSCIIPNYFKNYPIQQTTKQPGKTSPNHTAKTHWKCTPKQAKIATPQFTYIHTQIRYDRVANFPARGCPLSFLPYIPHILPRNQSIFSFICNSYNLPATWKTKNQKPKRKTDPPVP